jgi:hypothetical protein
VPPHIVTDARHVQENRPYEKAWATRPVCRYEPALLAKLASVHVREYGSDDLVKTSSGIDLVIR